MSTNANNSETVHVRPVRRRRIHIPFSSATKIARPQRARQLVCELRHKISCYVKRAYQFAGNRSIGVGVAADQRGRPVSAGRSPGATFSGALWERVSLLSVQAA
jgi:hypothetical protein